MRTSSLASGAPAALTSRMRSVAAIAKTPSASASSRCLGMAPRCSWTSVLTASATARSRPHSRRRRARPTPRPSPCPGAGRLRLSLPLLVVLVEALARLHAEVTREIHPLQERRGRPFRFLEFLEEHVRDVIVDIHSGVVDELEWTHRMAQPELHGLVDVV